MSVRSRSTPDLDAARDFVYRRGALWERALFGWLVDDRPAEEAQRALSAYRNPDGGFGHGLEHDLRAPASNPAQLEFLLFVERVTALPLGPVLDGAARWLEDVQGEDGALANPADLGDWPIAPWWAEWGGQRAPDSVVGNLARLGLASDALLRRTHGWVARELTPERIGATEWLFMLYHPLDWFFGVREGAAGSAAELAAGRGAAAARLVELAEGSSEAQRVALLGFLRLPGLAERVPGALVERTLEHLAAGQQEDGGWRDEHGLPVWYPFATLSAVAALRRHGRL